MRKLLGLLGLVVGAVAIVPVARADVLVLRADGPSAPSLKAGTRLLEGARLQLRRGDRLVILDPRGTIDLRGPTVYVVGARRVPHAQVSAALVRNSVGAVRAGLDAVVAGEATALIDRASAASRSGDFAASDALLQDVETKWSYEHRAECRLVDNLRLYNAIARADRAAVGTADRCADEPIAKGTEQLLRQLDAERAQLLKGAATLTR